MLMWYLYECLSVQSLLKLQERLNSFLLNEFSRNTFIWKHFYHESTDKRVISDNNKGINVTFGELG